MTRDDIETTHTCHDQCERPACVAVRKAVAAERNKLAAWMMAQGYSTGHGDTMEQLLEELSVEIRATANTHQPSGNTHQGVAQARAAERRLSYVCPQCFYTLEENQWVGLTRDERMEIINRLAGQDWVYVVDEIEAKLKEKNQNERTN